ncbi:Uncharacterized protein BM_BM13263 [Brugia malayi]|uniref:Bm13263 n=1 Tax=Brugia malayi TaxID=6279 RepID=A0A0K0IXA8_BRUMA|nr:Bm13263 [Brugia malayi]VIO91112.1 Uncharacterized protein BM_BM13263 [Brugia malayi]
MLIELQFDVQSSQGVRDQCWSTPRNQ